MYLIFGRTLNAPEMKFDFAQCAYDKSPLNAKLPCHATEKDCYCVNMVIEIKDGIILRAFLVYLVRSQSGEEMQASLDVVRVSDQLTFTH